MDDPGTLLDTPRPEPPDAATDVIDWLAEVLADASRDRASALHIAAGLSPMIRVAGAMRPLTWRASPSVAHITAIAKRLLPERLQPRWVADGVATFAWELAHRYRCRVTMLRQQGRPTLTLRLVPAEPLSADALGLPPAVSALARRPHGLVLVAGAGVSGTTSTVNAILAAINHSRACRVVTLEDPVETLHTPLRAMIDQREVGSDVADVAQGIADAVAADADVIVVSDVGDPQSARRSVEAAQAGRLILATVDAPSTRLAIDAFVRMLAKAGSRAAPSLARVLDAVTAQRLLPRATEGEGPSGLVAAFEVLIATGQVRSVVQQGRLEQIPQLLGMDRDQGMQSMDMAMDELYRSGVISALSRASAP